MVADKVSRPLSLISLYIFAKLLFILCGSALLLVFFLTVMVTFVFGSSAETNLFSDWLLYAWFALPILSLIFLMLKAMADDWILEKEFRKAVIVLDLITAFTVIVLVMAVTLLPERSTVQYIASFLTLLDLVSFIVIVKVGMMVAKS